MFFLTIALILPLLFCKHRKWKKMLPWTIASHDFLKFLFPPLFVQRPRELFFFVYKCKDRPDESKSMGLLMALPVPSLGTPSIRESRVAVFLGAQLKQVIFILCFCQIKHKCGTKWCVPNDIVWCIVFFIICKCIIIFFCLEVGFLCYFLSLAASIWITHEMALSDLFLQIFLIFCPAWFCHLPAAARRDFFKPFLTQNTEAVLDLRKQKGLLQRRSHLLNIWWYYFLPGPLNWPFIRLLWFLLRKNFFFFVLFVYPRAVCRHQENK